MFSIYYEDGLSINTCKVRSKRHLERSFSNSLCGEDITVVVYSKLQNMGSV